MERRTTVNSGSIGGHTEERPRAVPPGQVPKALATAGDSQGDVVVENGSTPTDGYIVARFEHPSPCLGATPSDGYPNGTDPNERSALSISSL
jgi:hypothetical protein